jgi:hypothetical protein
LKPAEIPFNAIWFLNVNLEISIGRGLLALIQKLCYAGMAFTMKMNSDNEVVCDNTVNNQKVDVLK